MATKATMSVAATLTGKPTRAKVTFSGLFDRAPRMHAEEAAFGTWEVMVEQGNTNVEDAIMHSLVDARGLANKEDAIRALDAIDTRERYGAEVCSAVRELVLFVYNYMPSLMDGSMTCANAIEEVEGGTFSDVSVELYV